MAAKSKPKIQIKKENEGKYSDRAKAKGNTVQQQAKKDLNNPNATPTQKKRANFARNAAKWKKGGKKKQTK